MPPFTRVYPHTLPHHLDSLSVCRIKARLWKMISKYCLERDRERPWGSGAGMRGTQTRPRSWPRVIILPLSSPNFYTLTGAEVARCGLCRDQREFIPTLTLNSSHQFFFFFNRKGDVARCTGQSLPLLLFLPTLPVEMLNCKMAQRKGKGPRTSWCCKGQGWEDWEAGGGGG